MKEHPVFWPFDRFWTEVEQLIRRSRMPLQGPMIGVQVTETDREVIAVVEIPGLYRRHDLDVRVAENRLMVRGGTGSETRKGGESRPSLLQRSETYFFVAHPLPAPVDASRMKTELKENTLIVRIPKRKNAY
ncbi:Hsp20/alpha crystallin family protein [Planifilum fimeticola]